MVYKKEIVLMVAPKRFLVAMMLCLTFGTWCAVAAPSTIEFGYLREKEVNRYQSLL